MHAMIGPRIIQEQMSRDHPIAQITFPTSYIIQNPRMKDVRIARIFRHRLTLMIQIKHEGHPLNLGSWDSIGMMVYSTIYVL